MKEPEFLICLECETPCYSFDFDQKSQRIVAAQCQACGNDEVENFEADQSEA